MTRLIDAHHHFWLYTPEQYGWISDDMDALRRDFLMSDLCPLLRDARVDGTVAVQARQSVDETRWLLSLAGEGSPIRGVVGWLPLAAREFPALLDEFQHETALKGLRHVVQSEPDGFLDASAFNDGIRRLRGTGLVYDLLIVWQQMPEAVRFADRHPDQVFVLDHLAKPPIRSGEMEPWASGISELARRENICCKVSGMVTEADPSQWTVADLKPYVDVVLDAFGPQRLMAGSDWPVLTVGCDYAKWWQTVEDWVAPLSETERAAILGGTATRVYHLEESAG